MGASVRWRPNDDGKSLPVNAPSSFMEALADALGRPWPMEVHESDCPVLRGLRAGLKHEADAINELIDAVSRHGSVELFAQW